MYVDVNLCIDSFWLSLWTCKHNKDGCFKC
uniref:Uncharacterized protein n=1 Tax=Anguilla anguilla TaxID=7936 RepID=A0A0E9TQS7_ANGAN